MSTRNVERELTTLLHRHAEDAMDSTDTQTEQNRFYDVLDAEPSTNRRSVAVVGAVAATGVVAALVWSLGGGDTSGLPPTGQPSSNDIVQQEREAELFADRVVAAYAAGDVRAVASMSTAGAQSWADLRRKTDRDRAWSVEYLMQPCEATSSYSNGITVECAADMHLLHSEEVGAGPFERSGIFTIMVQAGAVANGDVSYEVKASGMGDHIDDAFTWVEENYPEDAEFLLGDEIKVPASEWDRWTLLWQQYSAAYAAEKTGEGDG